jgi:hypothetical protein
MTITINVPVVYMARDVIILMRANPFQGLWKAWALKMARVMDLPQSKSLDPSAK